MSEAKTVLKRLGIYYFFLGILTVLRILPEECHMHLIPDLYLAGFCICLILYYSYRVVRPGGMKAMIVIAWLDLFFAIVRDVKYHVFFETEILERYTWYLFYVPLLMIPLCFFIISLLVSETENAHLPKKWYWIFAVTALLIVLVLTNDIHQLAFKFNPGFENWNSDYSYGVVFYAMTVWENGLYLIGVVLLVKKCGVSSAKRNAWLIRLPFALGIIMLLLNISGKMPRIFGIQLMQVPEIVIFMVATVLEVCMQLGMIPTNEKYSKIFRNLGINAQITDFEGKVIYKSDTANMLTDEQFMAVDGTRIGEHTVLHRMALPGGFGFWMDDVTEPDRLNNMLEESRERLAEKAELTRLQNELDEKQTQLEQHSLVYDRIAKQTIDQSGLISRLAKEAFETDNRTVIDRNRKLIILVASYIKRYANLMLISADKKEIDAGEVVLSFAEILHRLSLFEIPAEIVDRSEGTMNSEAALELLETFEIILEEYLSELRGVTVNASNRPEGVCWRLAMENIQVKIPEARIEKLMRTGLDTVVNCEDEITYIDFIPGGAPCFQSVPQSEGLRDLRKEGRQ